MQGNKEGGRSRKLLLAVLELLHTAVETLGLKMFRCKEHSDRLIHIIWLQFATSYTSQRGSSTTSTCTAYLKVLFSSNP